MFGKKKKAVRVMHYEGIDAFPMDQPCTLEINADVLNINRIKPETSVILPMNRISSISTMDENSFLQKFKGSAQHAKQKIPRLYLVIQYDKGILVFWGTATNYKAFLNLQKEVHTPNHIEL
jgi:hypothetical protein